MIELFGTARNQFIQTSYFLAFPAKGAFILGNRYFSNEFTLVTSETKFHLSEYIKLI